MVFRERSGEIVAWDDEPSPETKMLLQEMLASLDYLKRISLPCLEQVADKSAVEVEEALRQTLLASKKEKQVQDQS